MPIKSFLPFQFRLGVINTERTLRSFVETIFIYSLRYSFDSII